MTTKIILRPESAAPRVVHPSTYRIYENAKGGPYRYGAPLMLNAEAISRMTVRKGRGYRRELP